ncbi:MAG TPA: hypothetical protein VIQ30_02740 [Pseudonocardia sp.]
MCTALQCTPNDLIEVDNTPVRRPTPEPHPVIAPKVAIGRGRSMPPM